jgi:hypothetical protein
MGKNDYFLSYAVHAHTKNELGFDPIKEEELRKANSMEEARRFTEMVTNKLEKDISRSGYGLNDVRLLILYLSYRGEPKEKDVAICESVLDSIREKFEKGSVSNQLRLVGRFQASDTMACLFWRWLQICR